MPTRKQNWSYRAFGAYERAVDAGMEFLGSDTFARWAIGFLVVLMVGGSLFGFLLHHGL